MLNGGALKWTGRLRCRFPFSKGGKKSELELSGYHTTYPPRESLCSGAGKEDPTWNSRPALYPCKNAGEVLGVPVGSE